MEELMHIIKSISIYLFTIFFITACGGGSDSGNTATGTVSVTLNLDQLPSSITYNRAATPDGYVEFNWGVTFDINDDGIINQGDVTLRLLHFKAAGSSEITGPISNLTAKLWLYISDTTVQSVAVASKQIAGNSITISIDKSAHSSLSSISDTTLVYFLTSNNDISGLPVYDYYPSFKQLISIPVNNQFTDPQGDVSEQEIDMVSMSLAF